MNKVVFKEFEKRHLVFDIVLYALYAVVGFVLLGLCKSKLMDGMNYAFAIFYIFAFISILVYFLNRRPINYETLFLGFINVFVGTFTLVCIHATDKGFILSDAILIYAILVVLNKLYHCMLLLNKKDINFFPKMAVTILLFFIGVVVVASIHDKVDAGILILGYYFSVFGLLSLLEPLIRILSENNTLHNYMVNILSYEKEEKREKPSVKVLETSKPVVKKKKRTTTKKTTSSAKTKRNVNKEK